MGHQRRKAGDKVKKRDWEADGKLTMPKLGPSQSMSKLENMERKLGPEPVGREDEIQWL